MSISTLLLSMIMIASTPDAIADVTAETTEALPCDGLFKVSQQAYKFDDLPKEIYDDLLIYSEGRLGNPDDPLLQTDAPTEKEKTYATLRLERAWMVEDTWYVSLQVSMISGRLIFGFRKYGNIDRYQMRNTLVYKGPMCAVIDASLKGVLSGGVIK